MKHSDTCFHINLFNDQEPDKSIIYNDNYIIPGDSYEI